MKGGVMKPQLTSEIGQSFALMGFMAAVMAAYLGMALLAVRVLG